MFADYWELQNLGLDKWVPVTTAWHIVAVNILNKQFQTAVKGWSYRLCDGRGANSCSLSKITMIHNIVPLSYLQCYAQTQETDSKLKIR